MKKIRSGWRYFECSECGHKWEWPTRDHTSPSGEDCPKCNSWEFPYKSEVDEGLPCDRFGNLTIAYNIRKKDLYR